MCQWSQIRLVCDALANKVMQKKILINLSNPVHEKETLVLTKIVLPLLHIAQDHGEVKSSVNVLLIDVNVQR